MAKRQGTPIWITCGCGCGLLLLLIGGGFLAAGFFGVSAVKGFVEDMKDPVARTAKAREILGADELPEGYTAHMYLKIPWFIDMAMLSDSEPVSIEGEDFDLNSENLGKHLFVYLSLPGDSLKHEEFEELLRGELDRDGVKTDIDLDFDLDPQRELTRGDLEIRDQKLSYVAYRGVLALEEEDVEGVFSQILFECPGKKRTRAGIWFQRGSSLKGADGQDLGGTLGTPADEETLRGFMNHFNVCN